MKSSIKNETRIVKVSKEESVNLVSLIKEMFDNNEWVEKHIKDAKVLVELCEHLSK